MQVNTNVSRNHLAGPFRQKSDKPTKEWKPCWIKPLWTLTIIGALNWGSIGIFQFDIVAWLFGGQGAMLSRIVYTLVALAGIWCISLLFRDTEAARITE